MERIIKFRAYWKGVNKMSYFENGRFEIIDHPKDETKNQAGIFIPMVSGSLYMGNAEIMQFTDLTDKNGKPIYEGDVLRQIMTDGKERFFKIWSEKGGLVINQHQDDFYKSEDKINVWAGLSDMQTISWIEGSLEIIGNIYETPELINEKKANG